MSDDKPRPARGAVMADEDLVDFVGKTAPLLMQAGYDRARSVALAYDLAVDVAAELYLRGGQEGFAAAVRSTVEQRRPDRNADTARRT